MFWLLIIGTEEVEEVNQIMVKQLKNRYNDLNRNKRFVIGIDRSKMKLYDCIGVYQDDMLTVDKKKSIIMTNLKRLKTSSQS